MNIICRSVSKAVSVKLKLTWQKSISNIKRTHFYYFFFDSLLCFKKVIKRPVRRQQKGLSEITFLFNGIIRLAKPAEGWFLSIRKTAASCQNQAGEGWMWDAHGCERVLGPGHVDLARRHARTNFIQVVATANRAYGRGNAQADLGPRVRVGGGTAPGFIKQELLCARACFRVRLWGSPRRRKWTVAQGPPRDNLEGTIWWWFDGKTSGTIHLNHF